MARKYFDVLVRTPHGLKCKPVDNCGSHAEARDQGRSQYDGEILDSRFNGTENTSSTSRSSGGGLDGDLTFAGIVLLGGIVLIYVLWPIALAGAVCYGAYKIYKWISK